MLQFPKPPESGQFHQFREITHGRRRRRIERHEAVADQYRYLDPHRTLAFGARLDVNLADARSRRDEARLLSAGTDPSRQQKVDAARARIEENDTFKTVAKKRISKNEREGVAEMTLSKIR